MNRREVFNSLISAPLLSKPRTEIHAPSKNLIVLFNPGLVANRSVEDILDWMGRKGYDAIGIPAVFMGDMEPLEILSLDEAKPTEIEGFKDWLAKQEAS